MAPADRTEAGAVPVRPGPEALRRLDRGRVVESKDGLAAPSLERFRAALERAMARPRTMGGSIPEVLRITRDGVWLRVGDIERLLPFEDFPYSKFRKARVEAVLRVEWPHPGTIRWPDVPVDVPIVEGRY